MQYQITHDFFLCRGMYVLGKIIDMRTLDNGSVLIDLIRHENPPQVRIPMSDIQVK